MSIFTVNLLGEKVVLEVDLFWDEDNKVAELLRVKEVYGVGFVEVGKLDVVVPNRDLIATMDNVVNNGVTRLVSDGLDTTRDAATGTVARDAATGAVVTGSGKNLGIQSLMVKRSQDGKGPGK